MRKAKVYVLNALLVSAVGLILRFAGMAYNVYISGKLGAQGMGLLTLILSVYALASSLALSGVNMTCTRLCADALASGNYAEARRSLTACALYSLAFGLLAACLLFVSAPLLAQRALGQPRALFCLRALCPALPAASLSACFTGYLTAARHVTGSSLVSIFGQGFKMLLTALLLALSISEGRQTEAVLVATCVSEVVSFFCLCGVLCFDLSRRLPRTGKPEPRLTGRLLSICLPLATAGWVRSALVSAEHVLIPKGLARCGDGNALATYGLMHGMALPVVFFPYAVLTPFTALLLPEISRFKASGQEKEISFTASLLLRMTMLFSAGCAALLVVFGQELGQTLYRTQGVGTMIAAFSFLIPVMYIDTAADAVLKGLGQQVYCMKVNVADAAISLVLVLTLVPRLGAYGYLVTVFLSECFNTFFSVRKLRRQTRLSVPPFSSVALPLLCAFAAAGAVKCAARFWSLQGYAALSCAAGAFLLLYLPALRVSGAFKKEDRRYFLRLLKK